MSASFLLAHWNGSGNLSPLLTAARRLAQRGHRVRVIGDADSKGEIEMSGFAFRPWTRAVAGRLTNEALPTTTQSALALAFEQVIFGPAAAYAADTAEALEEERTDAVLAHDVLFGAALAAEAKRIPSAFMSPHVSVRPLPGVPPVMSGLAPPRSAAERMTFARMNMVLASAMNAWLPGYNDLRARLGLDRLAHVFQQYDRLDRLLLAMSPAFDFPCNRLPANVRYVGPLLDPPAWSRPWAAPWSGAPARPRILVSFSTTNQAQAPILQRIVTVLGHLDVDAVVTTGPAMDGAPLDARPNVTLVPSAPHDAVMSEVSLVITHGGHGTVMRSLVHGVPLLILPMGRDQADNAIRVVARGAGLSLGENATGDEISAAVSRLLADPGLRAAARRLGAAIEPDLSSTALVTEMEHIALTTQRRAA